MKTKEINVWVNKYFYQNYTSCHNDSANIQMRQDELYNIKAKLVVEIPEKKIEITESELDEVLDDFLDNCGDLFKLKLIKKKLGFL